MKFVVDFEEAKTTHTQTRVPARLISVWQGVDKRVAKSGSGQGRLTVTSAKEGTQEQGSRKGRANHNYQGAEKVQRHLAQG